MVSNRIFLLFFKIPSLLSPLFSPLRSIDALEKYPNIMNMSWHHVQLSQKRLGRREGMIWLNDYFPKINHNHNEPPLTPTPPTPPTPPKTSNSCDFENLNQLTNNSDVLYIGIYIFMASMTCVLLYIPTFFIHFSFFLFCFVLFCFVLFFSAEKEVSGVSRKMSELGNYVVKVFYPTLLHPHTYTQSHIPLLLTHTHMHTHTHTCTYMHIHAHTFYSHRI